MKAQQVKSNAEPSMAYRFTDLAQMVCKVSKDKYHNGKLMYSILLLILSAQI